MDILRRNCIAVSVDVDSRFLCWMVSDLPGNDTLQMFVLTYLRN